MSTLDALVTRIQKKSVADTVHATRALRGSVKSEFLPLFDHLLNLAENDIQHRRPQSAGVTLRQARKLAGHTKPMRKPSEPRYGVREVKLDRGGYDRHGRYFGIGAKLWERDDEESGRTIQVRASSKAAAIQKFKTGQY